MSAIAERLVEHNRVEEQKVYLWPDALLDRAELETLRAGILREIENLSPTLIGTGAALNYVPRFF